jgi:hypothetical protein
MTTKDHVGLAFLQWAAIVAFALVCVYLPHPDHWVAQSAQGIVAVLILWYVGFIEWVRQGN